VRQIEEHVTNTMGWFAPPRRRIAPATVHPSRIAFQWGQLDALGLRHGSTNFYRSTLGQNAAPAERLALIDEQPKARRRWQFEIGVGEKELGPICRQVQRTPLDVLAAASR